MVALDPTLPGRAVGDRVRAPCRAGASAARRSSWPFDRSRWRTARPGSTSCRPRPCRRWGLTALIALRGKAGLRPGERLLVRGAGGGVGSVAVQLGRSTGAQVTGLAGPRSLALVRELGAHEAHGRTTTPPADLGRFDVVLDTVGTGLGDCRRLLTPTGRMVAISFDLGHPLTSLGAHPGIDRLREAAGALLQRRRQACAASPNSPGSSRAVRPVVDTVRPLSGIAAAHRALEAGGTRGKHVVRLV